MFGALKRQIIEESVLMNKVNVGFQMKIKDERVRIKNVSTKQRKVQIFDKFDMKIPSALSSFIYKCDFFSTKVGFRFKEERQYASLTGGVASIVMILLFIGIFTNTGINTVNKEYIIASQNRKIYEDPSPISLSKDNKFYFMAGLTGIDMNSGIRFFDISMTYTKYNNTGNTSKKIKNKVSLVPCSKLSWASFDKESIFDPVESLTPEKWLCPPENESFELTGKYTSQIFQFIKFSVEKCNPETDLARRCANTGELNSYLQKNEFFTLNFYFVNTILNPEQKNHIKYYLEDKNYFPFTLTQGLNANIYVSQYSVKTDESLIPLEDIQEDRGGIVKQDTQYYPYYVTGTQYLKFYLRKSNQQVLITRSFRKIDDTLSYIGGLFSSLLTFLAIVCFYNELSYQLQIAKNIYRYDKDTLLDTNGFHFLNYIVYLFYFVLKLFGCQPNWKKMEQYDKSLIQVRKQMDVRLIFKKILFTQKLAAALLTPEQLTALHLQDKITINTAEEIRQNYFLPKFLLHEISQKKKNTKKQQKRDQIDDEQATSKVFSREVRDERAEKEMSRANYMVKGELENDEMGQNESSKEKITNSVSAITLLGKTSQCYLKLVEIIKKLVDEDAKGDMISKKILSGISPEIKQLLNLQSGQSSSNINQGFSVWESSQVSNVNFNSKGIQKQNSQSRGPLRIPDKSINQTQTCMRNLSALKDQRRSLQCLNPQKSFNQTKIKEIKDIIVVNNLLHASSFHQSYPKNSTPQSFQNIVPNSN